MELFFLCLKIFFARILDVTIGTVRTMLMVKGKTYIMGVLAFFEVFIWFIVAREALVTSLDSILIPIFYSLGYATGTLLGSFISNRYIKGVVRVEVIAKQNDEMLKIIKDHGYEVSRINLKPSEDKIKREMLYLQINNKSLNKLTNIIKRYDKEAFIVVSETKSTQNGFIK